ncbi:hypothetical protein ACIGWV_41140 [Streptomyces sp. NPDC055082]
MRHVPPVFALAPMPTGEFEAAELAEPLDRPGPGAWITVHAPE